MQDFVHQQYKKKNTKPKLRLFSCLVIDPPARPRNVRKHWQGIPPILWVVKTGMVFCGVYPIGSMGLAYLPTFTIKIIKINQMDVNVPYTDPMGIKNLANPCDIHVGYFLPYEQVSTGVWWTVFLMFHISRHSAPVKKTWHQSGSNAMRSWRA